MRSFKSVGTINDENKLGNNQLKSTKSFSNTNSIDNNNSNVNNILPHHHRSSSHHHREALSDLTSQENQNQQYRLKTNNKLHSSSSTTQLQSQSTTTNLLNSSNSKPKIQIYQQPNLSNNLREFKKPRLENEEGELIYSEETDEDKENFYDETIDEEVYNKYFHEFDDDRNIMDSRHIIEEFETIDDDEEEEEQEEEEEEEEEEVEEEEEEKEQHQSKRLQQEIINDKSSHFSMQPIWNNSIILELKRIIRKYSRNELDPNDEDTYDSTMVAEYAPEIFNYLRELENKYVPDANYMIIQDELKWEMRSVLIDWVVQVHSRFNLLPETLFLTVNYIDRFLSKRKVSLSRFQLVGAVALFIAAKYEEINCPTIQEVAYMADNAYSIEDFLKAERFMIDVLEFDMGWPGPMSFLRRTSKADDYDYETRTLAKYFLEITIMDSKFISSPPSWLAAGSHYLSRKLLGRGDWTELHVFYSGYTEKQLRPLAETLLENCRNAEINHKAIFDKYQERRYRKSSLFVQQYFEALKE
ncbi:unnamed protein product [Candida verbasci]|uniref:Cyclin N-terminal domain-containing protein n=1 Tax=Candida verbasci TaxID=1227364 RepID=A0A9W4U198_9ASCO|nr:unnamed protein product [Candida verbasci]